MNLTAMVLNSAHLASYKDQDGWTYKNKGCVIYSHVPLFSLITLVIKVFSLITLTFMGFLNFQ